MNICRNQNQALFVKVSSLVPGKSFASLPFSSETVQVQLPGKALMVQEAICGSPRCVTEIQEQAGQSHKDTVGLGEQSFNDLDAQK